MTLVYDLGPAAFALPWRSWETDSSTLQKPNLFTVCPLAGLARQPGHRQGRPTGMSAVLGPHGSRRHPPPDAHGAQLVPTGPCPDPQQTAPAAPPPHPSLLWPQDCLSCTVPPSIFPRPGSCVSEHRADLSSSLSLFSCPWLRRRKEHQRPGPTQSSCEIHLPCILCDLIILPVLIPSIPLLISATHQEVSSGN